MADATTITACLIGHMTYTQAPAVHEKNIFHLFRFTRPVKNYPYLYQFGRSFQSRFILVTIELEIMTQSCATILDDECDRE